MSDWFQLELFTREGAWFALELDTSDVPAEPQSWFLLELDTSDVVEPEPPPSLPPQEPGGGVTHGTYGPAAVPREWRFDAEVELRPAPVPIAQLELRVGAEIGLSKVFEDRVPGMITLSRSVELRTDATRLPSERWRSIIEDDEEVLLSL